MTHSTIDPASSYASLLDALRKQLRNNNRIAVIGIADGGVAIARQLCVDHFTGARFGTINPTFHRDDLGVNPIPKTIKASGVPFDVNDADILLVDDVFASGRTLRAALNELFDHGRPARVWSAALVDTDSRRLPVCLDFCGVRLQLAGNLRVQVEPADTKPPFAIKISQR